eukprot:GILK01020752.1.p1 GENE.GILK01020752.1~~GILK01020752.1.p1  ORF type:complete len:212 (-),score=26.06 GILK01020752.1:59-694(-)
MDVMNVYLHWAQRGFIFGFDVLLSFLLFALGYFCGKTEMVSTPGKVELRKNNGLFELWNAGSMAFQCDIETAKQLLRTAYEATLTARKQLLEQERLLLPSVDKWFEQDWGIMPKTEQKFWEEFFRWRCGILLLIEIHDILSYEAPGELKVEPLNETESDYVMVRNGKFIYLDHKPDLAGDRVWGPSLDILWKGYMRLLKKYSEFTSARLLT